MPLLSIIVPVHNEDPTLQRVIERFMASPCPIDREWIIIDDGSTDRSLEILGRMPSFEQIDFYECNGPTDAGLPYLAGLPNLKEIHIDSLPGVTLEGTKVFPPGVRVYYST